MPPNSEFQDQLIAAVRFYLGCSLVSRCGELSDLVCFPGDDPNTDVLVKTNCGMFVCGIWRKLGCQAPELLGPYHQGMALSWVCLIGRRTGARHDAADEPVPGAVLHYGTRGRNDDHVEFALSAPGADESIDHAGGGRPANLIGAGHSDWRWSSGRPLIEWFDSEVVCRSV